MLLYVSTKLTSATVETTVSKKPHTQIRSVSKTLSQVLGGGSSSKSFLAHANQQRYLAAYLSLDPLWDFVIPLSEL